MGDRAILEYSKDLDGYVKELLEKYHIPGASVAVVDGDEVFSKGYGLAKLPDVKATADTRYFAGSTTKAFLGAITATLVHDDENFPSLKWDTPISKLMPEDFVLTDEYATKNITVEDALSHRTGMPRHDLIYGDAGDTTSSVVRKFRHLPITAPLRTKYNYCNIMYGAVTDLVQRLTGKSLETCLSERFWTPLGMKSTSLQIPDDKIDQNASRGYYWHEDSTKSGGGEHIAEARFDLSTITGAGAIVSTVNDYTLWIKALLKASKPEQENASKSPLDGIWSDIVAPRSIMTEPPESEDFLNPALYALGWGVGKALGHAIVCHSGGLPGYGAQVFLLPGKNFGVVTMANSAMSGNIIGALIGAKLILDKFAQGGEEKDYESAAKSLARLSGFSFAEAVSHMKDKAERGRKIWPKEEKPDSSSPSAPSTTEPAKPPPPPTIDLNRLVGKYTHPAYGSINLFIHQDGSEKILRTYLAPRAWPTRIDIALDSDSTLTSRILGAHGIGDIDSEDLVWSTIFSFPGQFDLSDPHRRKIGLVLEPDMFITASKKGAGHEKEGSIWFESVE